MKLNSLLSKIMLGFVSSIAVSVVVFSFLLVIAMDFRANEAVRREAAVKAADANAIDNAALRSSEALARYLRTSSAQDLAKVNGAMTTLQGLLGADSTLSALAAKTTDKVQKSQVAMSSIADAAGALATPVATIGILSLKLSDPDLLAEVELINEAATAAFLAINKYTLTNDAVTAGLVLENLKDLVSISAKLPLYQGISARFGKTAGVLSRDAGQLVEKFQAFTTMIDERKAAVGELQAAFTDLAAKATENYKIANSDFHDAGVRAEVAGDRLVKSMLIAAPLIVVIGLALSYLVGRSISRPIVALSGVMGKLAGGDKAVAVPLIARGDEIGLMAKTVLRFKEAAIQKDRVEAEAADADRRTAAERERRVALDASKAEDLRAFVQAVDSGFEALAIGNLTVRMDKVVAPEFEPIRLRFNDSIAQLEATISSVVGSVGTIRVGLDEIAIASNELAQRTEQQAASLEETVAALSSVTSAVTESATAAGRAQSAVTSAQKSAERSGDIVTRAIAAMSEIEKSSDQIGKIIGVIDEIAFQTNLLALNAGVEAARAGEAGKGFAVVAQEVRGLAQRSAEAAKEIKTLIATSGAQVGQGVELVTASGRALDEIVQQVAEMSGVVSHIAESAREQATSLREVSTAADQMDKVTQQNAAMVEETTAAAQTLRSETDSLGDLVQKFRTRTSVGPASRRATGPGNSNGAKARPVRPMRSTGGRGAAVRTAAAAEDWNEF